MLTNEDASLIAARSTPRRLTRLLCLPNAYLAFSFRLYAREIFITQIRHTKGTSFETFQISNASFNRIRSTTLRYYKDTCIFIIYIYIHILSNIYIYIFDSKFISRYLMKSRSKSFPLRSTCSFQINSIKQKSSQSRLTLIAFNFPRELQVRNP